MNNLSEPKSEAPTGLRRLWDNLRRNPAAFLFLVILAIGFLKLLGGTGAGPSGLGSIPSRNTSTPAPAPAAAPAHWYEDASAAYNREDFATALRIIQPLAEGGNAKAQSFLGTMYLDGHGVTQDYAEAMKWLRRAADQRDALAQSYMALMYRDGNGVPQDYIRAYMWFNLAAQSNEPAEEAGVLSPAQRASMARDLLVTSKKMTPAQIAEGQRLASEWKPTPAQAPASAPSLIAETGMQQPSASCAQKLVGHEIQSWAQHVAEALQGEIVRHHEATEAEQLAYVTLRFRTQMAYGYNLGGRPPVEAMQSVLSLTTEKLTACFPPFSSLMRLAAQHWQEARGTIPQQKHEHTEEVGRQQQPQESQVDLARGYQAVSIETFLLDGKDLASKRAKVSLSGVDLREGNLDVLYADARSVMIASSPGQHQPSVPLLTDDASREFRKYLLSCQQTYAAAYQGCPVTVFGRVTTCTLSNAFGGRRTEPCVAVEDRRQSNP